MEWFKNWFNQDYLLAYAHRDRPAAEAEIEALSAWLDLGGQRVLDLGCGSGRHLGPLSRRVRSVCGVDLSAPLLLAARAETPVPLVRADLRALPFSDYAFTLLTSFFTGFGYFETDAEHAAMLREWLRLLEPGGLLLLDYVNKHHLLETLEAETVRHEGLVEIRETRRVTPEMRVEKEIYITHPGEETRKYRESVLLYSPNDIQSFLSRAGFVIKRTLADLSGRPFQANDTRLVVFAERPR